MRIIKLQIELFTENGRGCIASLFWNPSFHNPRSATVVIEKSTAVASYHHHYYLSLEGFFVIPHLFCPDYTATKCSLIGSSPISSIITIHSLYHKNHILNPQLVVFLLLAIVLLEIASLALPWLIEPCGHRHM